MTLTRLTDPSYLRGQQYKTPSNLTARADLHQRFSTAPGSWPRWVMEEIALRAGERVLEVGGGPGWLWRENRDWLPAGLRVCFSDFSLGMVQAARSALGGQAGLVFANLDAQCLPFPSGAFDVVIANHMLYHVPNLPRALSELGRVLRPGGRLCAATNGSAHMGELFVLLHQFEPRQPEFDPTTALKYRLENAAEWLAPVFSRVLVRRRPDSLWVTDPGALVEYARSSFRVADWLDRDRAADLESFFQAHMQSTGGLHITKDAGVVLAWVNGSEAVDEF